MKYYKAKTGDWDKNIVEVDVENVTDKSVWIKGRRHATRSIWESYFPTFEAAKKFLLDEVEEDILTLKNKITRVIEYKDRIEKLCNTNE